MYPLNVRIQQKLLLPFLKNRINAPYISQAFFKSICDFVYEPKKLYSKKDMRVIETSKLLFCPSDHLHNFLEQYGMSLSGKVLVAGSSDVDFHSLDISNTNFRTLYLQNSFISDNKRIFTLPIGVEDLSLALNGLPWNLKPGKTNKQEKILVGPFSPTHSNRQLLTHNVKTHRNISIRSELMSPRACANLSRSHVAVACPRGNGEDTHRIWETLYRNSYPVVLENVWSKSLAGLEIPILLIPEWTQEALLHLLSSDKLPRLDRSSYPVLWTKYWIERFRSEIS